MQKSRGKIKLIKIIEVKIIIEGRIYKSIIDMCFISGCMPILWKRFYEKFVNDRLQNCYEKHYCRFNER